MELSKRYANFVRVGPDGNMGIYDQQGNRFIRENIGSDNKPAQIVIIPSSTDNNDSTVPTEFNSIGFMSDTTSNTRLNPASGLVLNLGTRGGGYIQYDFDQPIDMFDNGYISLFRNVKTALNGFSTIGGSPDLRIGVTAADTSAKTIFSSTVSGIRYEVKARILATSESIA